MPRSNNVDAPDTATWLKLMPHMLKAKELRVGGYKVGAIIPRLDGEYGILLHVKGNSPREFVTISFDPEQTLLKAVWRAITLIIEYRKQHQLFYVPIEHELNLQIRTRQ